MSQLLSCSVYWSEISVSGYRLHYCGGQLSKVDINSYATVTNLNTTQAQLDILQAAVDVLESSTAPTFAEFYAAFFTLDPDVVNQIFNGGLYLFVIGLGAGLLQSVIRKGSK